MTAVDSSLTLRALIDEFTRCGAEHAVACPGSRNTPILLQMASNADLTTWSQIDERSAGFFALGIAKAMGKPVILTCSSGTAAANFLPAVIEANEARVPLIVLTADRPPELREIGAGQTIDQTKIYGGAVKWFFDIGVPEATPDRLRWTRALACRAYWTAVDGRMGPVHINIPLREPLILDGPLPEAEPGGGGRPGRRPWAEAPGRGPQAATVPQAPVAEDRSAAAIARALAGPTAPRTVWIAGDLGHDRGTGAKLAARAAGAQVPLLADPLSGARSGPSAIAHFDLILREPGTAAALRPQRVVRFGDLPTSKPLRHWLAGLDDAEHSLIARDDHWTDPASRVAHRWIGDISGSLDGLGPTPALTDASGWLQRWTAADSAVAHAIAEPLMPAGLSEPAVATMLGQFLPADANLFVAASMPIRDVEEFFPALAEPPRVMANRGANGIDGTIATAFGIAAVSEGPTVLLVGDVTVAHDIGSLISARRDNLKLTVVLINNQGGGIFNFLPVANEGTAFERYVATPTGLEFQHAASLYGLGYTHPTTPDEFIAALLNAIAAERSQLIEVRTDRTENRTLHSAVEAAAMTALTQLR